MPSQDVAQHQHDSEPAEACPACAGTHTVTGANGNMYYKNRLSCCEAFTSKSVNERAAIIQQARGCIPCLDWTGSHQVGACQAKGRQGRTFDPCKQLINWLPCGKRHNHLIHGMGNSYCNSIRRVLTSNIGVPNVLGKDALGTPTVKEIEAADNIVALLQLQDIPVKSSTVKQASTFYDPGSNVNLVRKQFAKEAGWKGRPVLQSLQTTGGQVKAWKTEAYHVPLVDRDGTVHSVLAFSIDTITSPMNYVDVWPALKVFPEVNCLATILRPEGEVDLLLGIHYSDIHTILADPVKHRVDRLQLLTSKFWSGYLLDGAHPDVKLVASSLNLAAKEKAQATFATEGWWRRARKPAKARHRTARVTAVDFLECEELEAAHEKANDAKAADEVAIKKDALCDQMIADWKKAALVKAAAKVAVEKEAEEKAAAQRAAEEATKKDPLIGRSQGKASLWDNEENKQLSSQPTKEYQEIHTSLKVGNVHSTKILAKEPKYKGSAPAAPVSPIPPAERPHQEGSADVQPEPAMLGPGRKSASNAPQRSKPTEPPEKSSLLSRTFLEEEEEESPRAGSCRLPSRVAGSGPNTKVIKQSDMQPSLTDDKSLHVNRPPGPTANFRGDTNVGKG